MREEMRLVKFEMLIDNIQCSIGRLDYSKGNNVSAYGNSSSNPALALVFDYDKVNDFGKIIMNYSRLFLTEDGWDGKEDVWTPKYQDISVLSDIKFKTEAYREFIELCKRSDKLMGTNKVEAYKFVFWALMVLTVDKSDADVRLSLICDFARIVNITDQEVEDIIQIITFIYYKNTDFDIYQLSKEVRYIFNEAIYAGY